MYRKQLGRRNLTDEQRTVLIGRMYTARKNTDTFKGNQFTAKSGGDQNELHQKTTNPTATAIAKELGVGVATVKRAEQFANGLDALRSVSEEAADKVLCFGSD